MHPCLNVDEILRLIAHELVASGGKATAVSMACCCKSFEDPALDALWATQDQPLPLLKSFPGDVWKEDEYRDECRSFKRLPTAMEWARFRKYTQRMGVFTQFDNPDTLSLEVLSVIQLRTINEPLFPNLKTLDIWGVKGPSIPFIPLFLSPRTTSILLKFESNLPEAMVASIVTTLPTLCPNIQTIRLYSLPRDSMVTAAISEMLLATNQNTLQEFDASSPLTEEASEVLYKLPSLRSLSVDIERKTLLPSASLPNLTKLTITCDNEDDWPRLFHGATLGKLESVAFFLRSEQIGDFLGTFKRAVLHSSVQNTLSKFYLSTPCSWDPVYSSLLPFTQMVVLDIWESFCHDGCSSRVDDDIVISLSRAMPKLETLGLGGTPCRQTAIGVTAKGLMALAHHCPNLSTLRTHLQAASLSDPLVIAGIVPRARPAASWTDCALTRLEVGETPLPHGSTFAISLALLRIFPRLDYIGFIDEEWGEVKNAINHLKPIIDYPRATPETSS